MTEEVREPAVCDDDVCERVRGERHVSDGLLVRSPRNAQLEHADGLGERRRLLVELPEADSCCGFGGIFSVEHPELSAEWLKRKINNLEMTQSPTLVVTEAGCLMHLAGGLHRQNKAQKVLHIAEILNHK